MDAYIDVVGSELREIVTRRHMNGQFDPDPHGFNSAASLCFMCGIALGTAWISCSTPVVLFAHAFGPNISNEMQFCYNAPILSLVLFQKKIDPFMCKCMGSRMWMLCMALFSFLGNATVCYLWEEYSLTREWLNILSVMIGVFSAVGYGAFILVVGEMSEANNVAFRTGFMMSGLANLAQLQGTGYGTLRMRAHSSEEYWITAGVIVTVGLFAATGLLTRKEIKAVFDKKDRALRAQHGNVDRKSLKMGHMARGIAAEEVHVTVGELEFAGAGWPGSDGRVDIDTPSSPSPFLANGIGHQSSQNSVSPTHVPTPPRKQRAAWVGNSQVVAIVDGQQQQQQLHHQHHQQPQQQHHSRAAAPVDVESESQTPSFVLFLVIWPSVLSIFLSFGLGMIVFVHFPYAQSSDPFVPSILVYINMFADVLGQELFVLMLNGRLPNFVSTQGNTLWLSFGRYAMAGIFFLHCDGIIKLDDILLCCLIAVFVTTAGIICAAAYHNACSAVITQADRASVTGVLSVTVFLALYVSFGISYVMFKTGVWDDVISERYAGNSTAFDNSGGGEKNPRRTPAPYVP